MSQWNIVSYDEALKMVSGYYPTLKKRGFIKDDFPTVDEFLAMQDMLAYPNTRLFRMLFQKYPNFTPDADFNEDFRCNKGTIRPVTVADFIEEQDTMYLRHIRAIKVVFQFFAESGLPTLKELTDILNELRKELAQIEAEEKRKKDEEWEERLEARRQQRELEEQEKEERRKRRENARIQEEARVRFELEKLKEKGKPKKPKPLMSEVLKANKRYIAKMKIADGLLYSPSQRQETIEDAQLQLKKAFRKMGLLDLIEWDV